jgi:hypothetical protein
MPEGSVKYVHVVGHTVSDETASIERAELDCFGLGSAGLEFVGAVMDVTTAKRAEEELHEAQAALAHVTRVTTLGELTASVICYFNVGLKPHAQVKHEMAQFMDEVAPAFEGKHKQRTAA